MPSAADGRQVSILVRTSAPRWLFDRTVTRSLSIGRVRATPGSSRSTACVSTRRRPPAARTPSTRRSTSASRDEAALLREQDVRLVVRRRTAARLRRRRAGRNPVASSISNFTWDWIYAGIASTSSAAPAVDSHDPGGLSAGDARLAAADARRLRRHPGVSKTSRSSRATRAQIAA